MWVDGGDAFLAAFLAYVGVGLLVVWVQSRVERRMSIDEALRRQKPGRRP